MQKAGTGRWCVPQMIYSEERSNKCTRCSSGRNMLFLDSVAFDPGICSPAGVAVLIGTVMETKVVFFACELQSSSFAWPRN